MEKKKFFYQITLQICSTLDIEKSLIESMHFFKRFFPIDELILAFLDGDTNSIKNLTHIDSQGNPLPKQSIPLSREVAATLMESFKKNGLLIPNPAKDKYAQVMAPYVNNQGFSHIILPLHVEANTVGYLVLKAKGLNVYKETDLDLVSSIRKPLAIATSNALRYKELFELKESLKRDNNCLRNELSECENRIIIGRERGLKPVINQVEQVAPLSNTVLLLGETGVGKEVIADEIHRLSPRNDGPFVKINCGAIPENLIDSELFGHEKGSFSGAHSKKIGRFERAHKGTLFLDEIGELPLEAQVRLLRALQTKEIERVGGTEPIAIDIRIIAATHRNLEKMVADGDFREDLWYRINAFPVFIPPLRHRREDIPDLLTAAAARKSKELGLRTPVAIPPEVAERLCQYDWPGNVRELENIVERTLIQNIGHNKASKQDILENNLHSTASPSNQSDCIFDIITSPQHQHKIDQHQNSPVALDDMIRLHITNALEQCNGKIHGPGGAADLLRINPSTLRKKMQKFGISKTEKQIKTTTP